MSDTNSVLNTWKKMSAYPGGKTIFSKAVQFKAPYFRTVNAIVEELKPNYAKLTIKKRRAVERFGRVFSVGSTPRRSFIASRLP